MLFEYIYHVSYSFGGYHVICPYINLSVRDLTVMVTLRVNIDHFFNMDATKLLLVFQEEDRKLLFSGHSSEFYRIKS